MTTPFSRDIIPREKQTLSAGDTLGQYKVIKLLSGGGGGRGDAGAPKAAMRCWRVGPGADSAYRSFYGFPRRTH